MTRQWERTHGWQSMLVPEVARRLGARVDDSQDPRANALVASAIACLDAAISAWSAGDGNASLGVLLDQAMSALRELHLRY